MIKKYDTRYVRWRDKTQGILCFPSIFIFTHNRVDDLVIRKTSSNLQTEYFSLNLGDYSIRVQGGSQGQPEILGVTAIHLNVFNILQQKFEVGGMTFVFTIMDEVSEYSLSLYFTVMSRPDTIHELFMTDHKINRTTISLS